MSDNLPRVSASKLKLYESCPKQYRYKYLLEDTREQISIYGVTGSAIHKAIELTYKEQKDPLVTYGERMQRYVTAEVDRFEDYSRVLAEGNRILRNFDFRWYNPVELEKHFKLPYPNDTAPICTIEGYIDLTERTRVVDFKSGKDKVDVAYVENDLQFIIYYWAFKQLYGKFPRRVTYHRLKDHSRVDGKKFNLDKLDTIIKQFISDPMEYEIVPCEKCPAWCGVKRYLSKKAKDDVISEVTVI